VGVSQKIGRRLGGAANTGEFRHPVRLHGHFKARLDNGAAHGVVATARAKRGQSAFIEFFGIAERVFGRIGVAESGSYECH